MKLLADFFLLQILHLKLLSSIHDIICKATKQDHEFIEGK